MAPQYHTTDVLVDIDTQETLGQVTRDRLSISSRAGTHNRLSTSSTTTRTTDCPPRQREEDATTSDEEELDEHPEIDPSARCGPCVEQGGAASWHQGKHPAHLNSTCGGRAHEQLPPQQQLQQGRSDGTNRRGNSPSTRAS
jgi:hypothetical protein